MPSLSAIRVIRPFSPSTPHTPQHKAAFEPRTHSILPLRILGSFYMRSRLVSLIPPAHAQVVLDTYRPARRKPSCHCHCHCQGRGSYSRLVAAMAALLEQCVRQHSTTGLCQRLSNPPMATPSRLHGPTMHAHGDNNDLELVGTMFKELTYDTQAGDRASYGTSQAVALLEAHLVPSLAAPRSFSSAFVPVEF